MQKHLFYAQSDTYIRRGAEFSLVPGLTGKKHFPSIYYADQGWIEKLVKSGTLFDDDFQKNTVFKLGGFHALQNAYAAVYRIYPSILNIPAALNQKHISDGKNHNSCRAYYYALFKCHLHLVWV